MPLRRTDSAEPGHKFAKPDIERIGLFIEMPYIREKWVRPKKTIHEPFNMICEGPKSKNATQQGYFEPVFKRIFSKEAIKGRGRKEVPLKYKKVTDAPFMPPPGYKLHSSPGDYYGCFTKFESFSNRRRPKPKYKSEGVNFLTCPVKKGGPGYNDICINRFPVYVPDRYGVKYKYKEYGKNTGGPMITAIHPKPYFTSNPFAEAPNIEPGRVYIKPKEKTPNIISPGYILPTGKPKTQGGCHAGCFGKFPEYKSDRVPRKKKEEENVFLPPPRAMRSFYNTSILHQRVDLKLNETNFVNYQPDYLKYISLN